MNDSTISSLKEKLNTSTWHLVLLGAATYGVYPLMWLYKYQDTIIDETRQRFSSSAMIIWMAVCLGISAMLKMAFPVQIDEYGDVYGYSRGAETMYGIATLVSLVWIILTIIWAFRARAALQQYALTQFRFELKMNPVWTFLFHIFYINYCINAMPESLAKHRIIYGEPDSRPRDNSPQ
ncbi:TPA: DUF4234 domain-containing protein [Escherichia coli]|nr:DUF4234 domain-containing protein [Escherichia coli]HAZ3680388.1 DUF4234 domain-containing protein [Escherichia coli]HAZ3906394.1 DUF4234 domain-containing protein [Escherichia coli]HBA7188812.1 DUF4234 domain-containing protein [Escherichia coli]HBA8276220.1 DUF4234 domain-containing protein [Escherichia coli]